jgi:hypothetical protein
MPAGRRAGALALLVLLATAAAGSAPGAHEEALRLPSIPSCRKFQPAERHQVFGLRNLLQVRRARAGAQTITKPYNTSADAYDRCPRAGSAPR